MKSRETVLESLNTGLHQAMAADSRVHMLGEDILDPYGGAFKVTSGLSSKYPERVWTTPISEAGIVGIAAGMALRGLLPIVEIMFGDFLSLAADQIINHIAKFPWMYSGGKSHSEQVQVPLMIRTPMGGRRGYGPTHSQTMEKLFLGTPGLVTIAPSSIVTGEADTPGRLLSQAILNDTRPVLFIENKLQYLQPLQFSEKLTDWDIRSRQTESLPGYPVYSLTMRGAPPAQITLAAYGYMADLARQAQYNLAYEHEIFCELVILTQLAPFDLEIVFDSVRRTGRLLTIEEGNLSLGWGTEVLARTIEDVGKEVKIAKRLAARDLPIPASGPLEEWVLPGINQIIEKCSEISQTR